MMTTTEIWQGLYEACCTEFSTGNLSTDQFKARLYRLGFRGQAIESEVNLHWPDARRARQASQQRTMT